MQIYTNSDVSEGWEVKCVCGVTNDDGEIMAECENCKTWQHIHCVLGRKKLAEGESFLCTLCRDADADAPQSKPVKVLLPLMTQI